MKRDILIVSWAEIVALFQAVAVIAISLVFLAGFLKYRAVYPFPLLLFGGERGAKLTPSVQGDSGLHSFPASQPAAGPSKPEQANQAGSERQTTQEPSSPVSAIPAQSAKRVPEDSAQHPLSSEGEPANRLLAEAQKLFEDGRYAEALARCNTILVKDSGNAKAKELKGKIEKAIQILEH
jgi:hypothetical protein